MHVRYWDNTANAGFTQHWSSEFLDKTSGNDVHSKFKFCSSDLKRSKLIQVLIFFICLYNVEIVIRGMIITKKR